MYDFFKIGMELAKATETTARAVMPLSGKGDKLKADEIAVETMRLELDQLNLNIRVLVGEGEKDNAPMLFKGESLGQRKGKRSSPCIDIIVDPLECTNNFARGLSDSLCVLGAAREGAMRNIPGTYMEQLLVPPAVLPLLVSKIDLDSPVDFVLKTIARQMGIPISNLTVIVQDRSRHAELILEIRKTGAGISLIESGSISAALKIIMGKSKRLNVLWGTFGAPEGLIIAMMAERSGYGFLGRIKPHDEKTRKETEQMGLSNLTLSSGDWVKREGVLLISCVHTSTLFAGVEYVRECRAMRVTTLLWTGKKKYLLRHLDGNCEEIEELT